jgi:hypothetical protein
MTTIDLDQLATVTGGHAGHDHGPSDLERRYAAATVMQRTAYSQCVKATRNPGSCAALLPK